MNRMVVAAVVVAWCSLVPLTVEDLGTVQAGEVLGVACLALAAEVGQENPVLEEELGGTVRRELLLKMLEVLGEDLGGAKG